MKRRPLLGIARVLGSELPVFSSGFANSKSCAVRNQTTTAQNSDQLMKLTSKVDLMPGNALPDFYLASGMKEHNSAKIVAFDQEMARLRDITSTERFFCFPYDEVVSVHFWKILQTSNVLEEFPDEYWCKACSKPATLRCSACNAVWYCSKDCQKMDWTGDRGHKIMCPKLQKT